MAVKNNSYTTLLDQARRLTSLGYSVIPVKSKDKKSIIKWRDRYGKLATDEELKKWFSNGKADCIAIILSDTDFAIDTDGKGEAAFTKVIPRYSDGLQEKIGETASTKTPHHGIHRSFKVIAKNFPEGIKTEKIVTFDVHNGIEIIGNVNNHCLIVYGPGYETINDIDRIVTFSKEEADELFRILKTFKSETNGIKTVIGVLKPHYNQPNRHIVALSLSGFLHKYGVPEDLILETIERLASENNDPEAPDRIRTVEDVCCRDANSEQVSGYQKLLEALDNDKKAISEIKGVFSSLCPNSFKDYYDSSSNDNDNEGEGGTNELPGINFETLSELNQLGVYAVVSPNPPVLYVAHTGDKVIRRYIIAFNKVEVEGPNDQITTHQTQKLRPKYLLIYSIPIKVVINDNSLTDSRSYSITFHSLKGKKPFTITGTISEIIDALDKNGKILRKPEAADALTAIVRKYETSGLAEINEGITQPGYYWIDGKIRGYGINQRSDFDPVNNEEDRIAALECIEALEGLQLKSKKKVAFPTALKWSILAPFSFITKTRTKGVDDWLPWLYPYDTTDTGKTTLIINTALSVWGKNDKEKDVIHFRGPGSLDSPSKLGITLSQTTYPILADEIGSIFNDDKNNNLLDIIKYAVQAKFVRSRFNENILALSPLALTSNAPPPSDQAYRRRFWAIQYFENEKWKEEEKKDFERWLAENNILDKVKTLGDFVATHVLRNPEIILKYSSYNWYEPATKILKGFYASIGKEPSEWLDLIAEQTLVTEVGQELQFNLMGFIKQAILDGYRRDVYTNPNPATFDSNGRRIENMSVSFDQKITYCLDNKSVTFLHLVQRNSGNGTEVAITSNIKSELKRYNRSVSAMSMYALASKIPGFVYDFRNVGGARARVICGSWSDFLKFLNCEVEE